MYADQVSANSPIRILEHCCRGGLTPGELGVVMARAGVGKTAFLVQVGLDAAMRKQPVLHVALGQDLPRSFTLLSGGANGAEAAFGEAAERCGLTEITFSFAGHQTARERGLVELSDAELERGSVSDAYITAQLHRSFPGTPTFQRLLKSIWHQVSTAGEVFVIGEILDDDTVKGGTGWGAELAKHLRKRLYVYDQTKVQWFTWTGDRWTEVEALRIRRTRFTGTGTRFLTDAGRQAIADLFERSFGET